MWLPTITAINRTTVPITEFRGLNHNLKINSGEWYDMNNLSCDRYPLLSTRKKRTHMTNITNLLGACYGSFATYIWFANDASKKTTAGYEGVHITINGEDRTDELLSLSTPVVFTNDEKTMVQMGGYIVVWPDSVYINTATGKISDSGYINAAGTAVDLTITPCSGDGTAVNHDYIQATEPTSPQAGEYWLDTSESTPCLKVYSAAQQMWTPVASTYAKIVTTLTSSSGTFSTGDGIKYEADLNQALTVYKPGSTDSIGDWTGTTSDSAIVVSIMSNLNDLLNATHVTTYSVSGTTVTMIIPGLVTYGCHITLAEAKPLNMTRKAPTMEYVTVATNRIWGCHWDGQTNELYCCKLGDVKNWSVYAGISTDAWASSVGTPGAWTGAITYNGRPTFFKDDRCFKIYISSTGAHQVVEDAMRGVAEGSSKSLCIIDGTLFWLSTEGVQAYTGSLPTKVSSALGDIRYTNGVAGARDGKLFLACEDPAGNDVLLVYDTSNGLWTREESPGGVISMGVLGGRLYCLAENGETADWEGTSVPLPNSDDLTGGNYPEQTDFFIWDACDTFTCDGRVLGTADFSTHDGETYKDTATLKYYKWTELDDVWRWAEFGSYFGVTSYELDPDNGTEDDFEWYADSGRLGTDYIGRKYITRMNLKLQLDAGASMSVYFQYDSSGIWEKAGKILGKGDRTFVLPIRPKRCDHFHFRLAGKGGMKLYAISKIWEIGSDV